MKKIVIILSALLWAAAISVPGNAEEWSLLRPSRSVTASGDGGAGARSPAPMDSVDIFSGAGFDSMAPFKTDQLLVTLLDVKGGATNSKSGFSRLQIGVGAKSESNASQFEPLLTDKLFAWKESPGEKSSAVVVVGVGLDFDSGYIQGKAFVGQPQEILGTTLYRPKTRFGLDGKEAASDSRGFGASGGYQINDRISVGAGIGRMMEKNRESSEEVYAVYAQAILALTPDIQMVPEVGKVELKSGDAPDRKEDASFYAGAKWEINF